MIVTINTDASFCKDTKKGGYAFSIVSNTFKTKRSGVFKTECINPDDAEARCIVNAMKIAMTISGATRIIVNTDSLNAIAILTAKPNKYVSTTKFEYIRQAYLKLFQPQSMRVEFRHVKAHTGINDARSKVNEWCDQEAKKQLNKARNEK